MGKKKWRIVIAVILAAWMVMFATDFYMATHLKMPLFVVARETADDGGSGTYQGLGYKVDLELDGNVPDEEVVSVAMTVFGKVIAASIR